MKNLLYSISILFTLTALYGCPSGKSGDTVVEKEPVDTMASSRDTVVLEGDTLIADSIHVQGDTLIEKEEKYKNDSSEKHQAPDHHTPDQTKLDSIKKAKGKKKKG